MLKKIKISSLLKILKVGVIMTLITPLFVLPKIVFPYILPKVFWFQFLVEILLIVYLLLIYKDKNYLPKINFLNISVTLFTVFYATSTFLSQDFNISFWGGVQWHNGLVMIFHLFLYFIIVSTVFKQEKDWLDFLKTNLIISAVVIFGALAQSLGSILSVGERVSSTLGNPNFLSTYLIFVIFLNVYFLIKEKNIHWRSFTIISLILGMIVFFLTNTRGSIIGMLAGMLMFGALYFIHTDDEKLKKITVRIRYLIIGVLIVVAVFSAFVFVKSTQEDWNRNRNIQTRLISWKVSLKAVPDHFFFGWGPENFYIAFNKHFDPQYLNYTVTGSTNYEAALNFAHNKMIDNLLSLGVFGFIGYLLIFLSVIYFLYKKRREHKFEFYLFTSLLTAYFVNSLFLFDFIVSFIMFYFVLALIGDNFEIIELRFKFTNKILKNALLLFTILLIAISSYLLTIKPLGASLTADSAYTFYKKEQYEKAFERYLKGLQKNTYIDEKMLTELEVMISTLKKANPDNEKVAKMYEQTLEILKKDCQSHPQRLSSFLQYAELLNAGDQHFDAIAVLLKAQELAPQRPEPLIHLGQTYIYLDDKEKALEYFKQAVEINDEFYISHLILGRAYELWDEEALTVEEFEKAIDLGYEGNKEILTVAKYYEQEKSYEKSLEYYLKALSLIPENIQLQEKTQELLDLIKNKGNF